MSKFIGTVIACGTLALSAFSQSSTSIRPRVAPTATPPVIANDPYKGPDQGGPPVLVGGGRRQPAGAATVTPTPDDDNGVIKVQTNLVTMPVSVLDRDGRFISGLQQHDFKIYENNVEQKIDYFQSVEQPFTVLLMIDVSPSTQFRIEEIQTAAIAFVNQLRPGDRVMVVSFDEHVHILSPVTGNRNVLRDAIMEAEFGDGTSLYDAVDTVIYDQLHQIQGRKAVVLFTDGVDTTSRHSGYDETLAATEEIDALFYTIRYDTMADMGGGGYPRGGGGYPRGGGGYPRGGGGGYPGGGTRPGGRVTMADILAGILGGGNIYGGRGGVGGSPADYEKGRRYLEGLAQNSGGREFEAQSMYNVDAAFSGIAEELRRQYSLGYYPEAVGKVGDRKQIRIRVMRPAVVVRAKTSYIVGQSDRTLAGK